jgi:RimJ/RimL family protein N-acetyltransferase
MGYAFAPVDRAAAEAIARWRYEGPYARYDGDPASVETLLRPDHRVHAVRDERGDLVGFCSFGEDGRVPGYAYPDHALDIGAGMRPDLVGRGLGEGFLRAVIEFADRAFAPGATRVTVAAFNRRALRVCLALGFREDARFARAGSDGDEFVVLTRR